MDKRGYSCYTVEQQLRAHRLVPRDLRRRIDQVGEDPTTYLGLVVEADSESLVVDDGEDGITVRDGSE